MPAIIMRRFPWSVRCNCTTIDRTEEIPLKRSGLLVLAVLSCIAVSTSAQVNRTGAAPPAPGADPPPKLPTYTPEQLFGTREPASPVPDASGPPVPPQVSTPSTATTPPPAAPPRPCAAPTPTASQFPGVGASQFQRAGVAAEAFTRPGVSAAELDALRPGARRSPCAPPREVLLYPEPENQPRRNASPAEEP